MEVRVLGAVELVGVSGERIAVPGSEMRGGTVPVADASVGHLSDQEER